MSAKKSWRKFNFKEWRSDQDLSRVSREARSFWLDLCGLIYEAEDKGRLSLKGRPYSIDDLAAVLGDDRRVVKRLLAELEAAQVFDRDSESFITSRRILREEVSSDFYQKSGRLGGNPALKNKAKAPTPLKPKNQRPEPEQENKKDLFSEPAGFRKRCKQAAGDCLKPRTTNFQLIIDLLATGWTQDEVITSIGDIADGKAAATIGTWKYFAVALANRRAERNAKPTASGYRAGAEEPMPREQGKIEARWKPIQSDGVTIARLDRRTGELRKPDFTPFDGEPPPEVAAAMVRAEAA